MTKKLLIIFLILILFSLTSVLAQEELPQPGLTPESRFYFLDDWTERIGLFFAFGTQKKVEKLTTYANEKMAEAKVMAEKNKPLRVNIAMERYEEYLTKANQAVQKARSQGQNVEGLVNLLKQKLGQNQGVLSQIYEKVPESAKPALERTMEMAKRAYQRIIETVSGEERVDSESEGQGTRKMLEIIKEKTKTFFNFLKEAFEKTKK